MGGLITGGGRMAQLTERHESEGVKNRCSGTARVAQKYGRIFEPVLESKHPILILPVIPISEKLEISSRRNENGGKI